MAEADRPLRIAVGGIFHETNSFATASMGLTPLSDFCRGNALGAGPLKGDAVLRAHRGARTPIGGYIDGAAALAPAGELVPLLAGSACPSGTIADAAYEAMRDELCARLRAALPVDAVALDLHGAGAAESYEDIELDLGRALRAVVGPAVPLVATWDLHGNVSPACARVFDYMANILTYPHVDGYARARDATRLLPRLAAGALRPRAHVERVPTLLPLCMMCTMDGHPAAELRELCEAASARAGVLSCSVFHGFPYADIRVVGTSVLCTAESDAALAERTAREVARWIWEHRERFRFDVAGADAAVDEALRFACGAPPPSHAEKDGGGKRARVDGARRPVVVNETADNTGCGAPGDSTHLLRAMLAARPADRGARACFATLWDPALAARAAAAGVGATLERVSIGGAHDPELLGAPLAVPSARVRCVSDGEVVNSGPMLTGERVRLGVCARLELGDSGVDVVVASSRAQTLDVEPFLLHGLDVSRYELVGLKSSTHFRAAFTPLAARIITADEPGLASGRLEVFEARRTRPPLTPMWPISEAASYSYM